MKTTVFILHFVLVLFPGALNSAVQDDNHKPGNLKNRDSYYLYKKAKSVQKTNPDSALFYCRKAFLNRSPDKHDSLECLLYKTMGYIYMSRGKMDSGLKYYQMAYITAVDINDDLLIAKIASDLAVSYYNIGNLSASKKYFDISLPLSLNLNDSLLIGRNYANLAAFYSSVSDFSKAYRFYNKALGIYAKTDNQQAKINIYINIAQDHFTMKKYAEAEKFLDIADSLNEGLNYPHQEINILNGYANIKMEQKDYSAAVEYLEKAIHLGSQNQIYLYNSQLYANLISCYIITGNRNRIIQYLNIAKKEARQTGNRFFLFYIDILKISYLYEELQDIDSARVLLEALREDVKSFQSLDIKIMYYETGYEIYKAAGIPQQALAELEQARLWNDSIINKKNLEQVSHFRIRMKAEQDENELKVRKTILNARFRIIWFVSAALILIFLLTVFLFIYYIQKNRIHKQLVQKNAEIVNLELSREREAMMKNQTKGLSENEKDRLFKAAVKAMETDKIYTNPDLTVQKFSEYIQSNRTYISQIIKEKTGFSFTGFLNHYRIREARRLLLKDTERKYTIEAIARNVGYATMPTFINAFKAETGITPSYFIKNIKNLA